MNIKQEIKGLVEFIKDEVERSGRKGCTVGVSGGVDSAVTVALCKLAFPDTTYGLSLPMEGNVQGDSSKRAKILCNRLSVPLETAIITPITGGNLNDNIPKVAKGNYYARQRMARLYLQAEMSETLVVGTDNLCESFIGYFTKFGDGGVDINPLGNYLKSEVRRLAIALNVTDEIINTPPSAELWEGQTDEAELGFTYDQLESIIKYTINRTPWDTHPTNGITIAIVNKILKMNRNTEHKRRLPKVYER